MLDLLPEIPEFLRTLLPVWRRYFTIELDENAANLLKGERPVEIEAHAEKRNGAGLKLRWIFRAGERLLTEEEVEVLTRRGGTTVILPSLGIVALAPERWESLTQWRRTVEETIHADGQLPPYLIFSLFSDDRLKVTLSAEVEAWRQRVLAPPVAPPPSTI